MERTNVTDLYQVFKAASGVSIDTRKINPGDVFFAIKGANFDGNTFAAQALSDGASVAVIDDPAFFQNDGRFFLVEDSLAALQELAAFHRDTFDIPIFAITGSNGKTTTKELTAAVLSKKYKVHFTQGNLNNHLGVPLTLLSMPEDTQIAVVEMGASAVGEIAALCSIAHPTHGLITNIGKAHLQGFGSYEGVLRGKSELYLALKESGGLPFINTDEPPLANMAKRFEHKEVFGNGHDLTFLGAEPFIRYACGGTEYQTCLVGTYNYPNLMAAYRIGAYFGVPAKAIHEALVGYQPANNRSQVVQKNGKTILLDAYNANPSSMTAALKSFASMQGEKTAILGDMLELGEESRAEHAKIIALAQELGLDDVCFVGSEFYSLKENGSGLYFEQKQECADYLQQNPVAAKLVLLKGSRGIGLEGLRPLL